MPYKAKAYLNSLSEDHFALLLATHMPLGIHPETHDRFLVPEKDRYTGTYGIGKPDKGKSGLIENMVNHDSLIGNRLIFLDPHGDSIDHVMARLYEERLSRVYLFDMGDKDCRFGLNFYDLPKDISMVAQSQAMAGGMHIFDTVWPETSTQLYLPLFLRAATVTLFANPGSTLLDLHRLIVDEDYRRHCLGAVTDSTTLQFWRSYDELSKIERQQQVLPIRTRLEALLMGRPLVRSIVGQSTNTIDFRRAIENRETLLFKLPPILLVRMRNLSERSLSP